MAIVGEQERVVSLLRRALEGAGGAASGAMLGNRLRGLAPDFSPSMLGYRNLTELVRAFPHDFEVARADADILFRLRHHDDSAIAARGSAAMEHKDPQPPAAPVGRVAPAALKPEVWSAFAFVDPQTSSFFDRFDGRVRLKTTKPNRQSSITTDDLEREPLRYVPIPALTPDGHLAIAKRFVEGLARGDIDPDFVRAVQEILSRAVWYLPFKQKLASRPDMMAAWRQFRTDEVSKRVRLWASTNSVDYARLTRAAPRSTPNTGGERRGLVRKADIRARILAAVARMNLSQLLALPIPAEHLLFDFDTESE